jgi:hypothetical protein
MTTVPGWLITTPRAATNRLQRPRTMTARLRKDWRQSNRYHQAPCLAYSALSDIAQPDVGGLLSTLFMSKPVKLPPDFSMWTSRSTRPAKVASLQLKREVCSGNSGCMPSANHPADGAVFIGRCTSSTRLISRRLPHSSLLRQAVTGRLRRSGSSKSAHMYRTLFAHSSHILRTFHVGTKTLGTGIMFYPFHCKSLHNPMCATNVRAFSTQKPKYPITQIPIPSFVVVRDMVKGNRSLVRRYLVLSVTINYRLQQGFTHTNRHNSVMR